MTSTQKLSSNFHCSSYLSLDIYVSDIMY